jgi:hypothetical protein
MNDGDVQPIILMKPEHRAFEDGVKTAQRLPAPKSAVGLSRAYRISVPRMGRS